MHPASISPEFSSSETTLLPYRDAVSAFLKNALVHDLAQSPAGFFRDSMSAHDPEGMVDRDDDATVPQSGSVLLLPVFYKARRSPRFAGKSICVPRFGDTRVDDAVLRHSGCNAVLRPAVSAGGSSIRGFIDAICSAGFVLASDAFVAMTAAAYGVPFGYCGNGGDISDEWAAAADLLGIPSAGQAKVDAAIQSYDRDIAPVIAIPPLWPLLCSTSGLPKTAGLLMVLKYELERSTGDSYDELNDFIEQATTRVSYEEQILASTTKASDQQSGQIQEMAEAKSALETEIAALEQKLALAQTQSASDRHDDQQQFAEQKAVLEQQVEAIRQRLATANEHSRRRIELHDAAEQHRAALAAENEQLRRMSAELASERNHLKRRAGDYEEIADTLRQDIAALSGEIDEQRRQSDRRVQGLAMEHEEELTAQRDAYRALEADLGRLQEEMVRLISEGSDRTQHAEAQFEAARHSAEQDIARSAGEQGAADQRNAALSQEIAVLTEQLAAVAADAETRGQQIQQLRAELLHVRSQADSLRDQSQSLVAQHVALRDNLKLTESEGLAKAARTDAALSRYWTLLGQSSAQLKGPSVLVKLAKLNRKSKTLRDHREIISKFLDGFSETELGLSKSGRKQRITQYLMGVTPDVEDFPILNRDIYLFLNPDVAAAGIDPFIHFIQNGQWESRIIHPTLDLPYYVARYPEVDKFKSSAVEHYFKFGVTKNYDPSPVFSTKWYFDHYTDVKMIGINPVIHYLRYPGCQPHPDFDSDYYRRHNLDVVSHGINPLAHYDLWGRHEGRRPKANVQPVFAPVAFGVPAPVPAPVARPAPPPPPSAPVAPTPVREEVLPAAPAEGRPIVVMMDAFYPRPDEDSGSLDQVNFIRIFQNLGYDVAFIALLNFGDAPDVGAKVSALGAHCITSAEFSSIEEYLFLNQERISIMFLSRVHFGGAWIERARAFCPKARILFNTVDLHHIREEREAVLRGDAEGAARALETKKLEYDCMTAADASIVVSEHEEKLLAAELPSAKVAVVPLMREIPRVDFPEWQSRANLAFIGGFQHQPNIDAVNYFLDDIWPIVLARRPELVFHVIGSHMPDAMKQRQAPNVEWVGHVPEIEPWLDRLRLTVAPLRYGAGAKGKVVSSLLNGVPCVATSVAAEGMGLRIGEDIVACQDPDEFATAIIAVHDDAETWNRVSRNGFETLSRTHSIEYAQDCVRSVLLQIA